MAVDTRPSSVPRDAGHGGAGGRGRLPLWVTAAGAALLAVGFRLGQYAGSYAHAGAGGASRARRAASAEPPPRRWKDILVRVYHKIGTDRVIALAAGITFYSLLALFPAIAALVSLYGLFADPTTIASHLDSLAGVMPAGAVAIIGDELRRLVAQRNDALGLTFVVGLATALWSANAGMKSLFDALNLVFDEPERRGFILLNAVSLAFTTTTIGFVIVALGAMVVLPIALDEFGIAALADQLVRWLRWPALLLVVMLGLALLYRFGPSHAQPRWRWITRGSAVAAVFWLVASVLFTWYAANFGSYNKTYGSLGAVIGFMMWIWISTIVMLLGAEIDAALEHRTAGDAGSAPAAE
jgi:membrane protein